MKLFDKRNIVLIMSIFLLLMMVSSVSAADVSEDAVNITKKNAKNLDADVVVECNGDVWEIDLTKYAPAGWNVKTDKAMISFDMQNTGANTRAMFKIYR